MCPTISCTRWRRVEAKSLGRISGYQETGRWHESPTSPSDRNRVLAFRRRPRISLAPSPTNSRVGRAHYHSASRQPDTYPSQMGSIDDHSPTEYVVIRRRYKHAPHDAVMYDAIVNERQQWLVLSPGELAPEVADAHRPDLVVLRPWLDPRITAVEVRLENIGRGGGSWVNAFAYANPGRASSRGAQANFGTASASLRRRAADLGRLHVMGALETFGERWHAQAFVPVRLAPRAVVDALECETAGSFAVADTAPTPSARCF